MGRKDSSQKDDDTQLVEVQERGEIFFFYRPKVETEHPHSSDDVQRMYMVLRPDSGKKKEEVKQSHESGKEGVKHDEKQEEASEENATEKGEQDGDEHGDPEKGKRGGEGAEKVNIETKSLFRFIVMGRKSLPDPSKRSRPNWGFVELVTTDPEDLKKSLGPEDYETATRGKRHQPAARPAGEGVYCIVKHGEHTHLVYRLELPRSEKKHLPQDELNIEEEASFIIQVKNPNHGAPPNAGLGNKRKATYPASLQGCMGSYSFVSADPVDFFNYEGCEFILISASDDIKEELGLELREKHDESCSELMKFLGKTNPLNLKPLIEGDWA